MSLWIVLYFVLVAAGDNNESEYMVQIKQEWVKSVKLQSEEFGLKFVKKIVSNIYLFKGKTITLDEFKKAFAGKVSHVELREHSKLRFVPWLNDSPAPLGFQEWVLTRRPNPKLEITWPYYGMDIQEAWSMSMTGQGIVVAVVDSGVDFDHKDLKRNINKEKSKSFIESDTGRGRAERLPSYPETDVYTSHGTKAAGLIAAELGNGVCSAGVAFNATLISLKVFTVKEKQIRHFGITFPDDHIAQALEYKRSEIDIYSCSFGLANMFSNSTNHIRTVLHEGVIQGRNGKGSIYVFAAGNRGDVYDCNTVLYSNSIYTITIASVGRDGEKPSYAIPCSSVLAATYGECRTYNGSRKLNTTTLDGQCDEFIGTSASTALASGIIALILQANKSLTWRDVQHIIVRSSSVERLKPHNRTTRNGKGLQYNPYFGFGLMNATEAILLAKNWTTVPDQVNYTIVSKKTSVQQASISTVHFPSLRCPQYIEHVRVLIVYRIEASIEKNLQISLRSPAGTQSILLTTNLNRRLDNQNRIERKWNFTSVQFWGETPYGDWTLRLRVQGLEHSLTKSKYQFICASVTFFGTATDPYTQTSHSGSEVEDNQSKCTTTEEIDKQDKMCLSDLNDIHNATIFAQDYKLYFINAVLIFNGFVIIICFCAALYMYMTGNLVDCSI